MENLSPERQKNVIIAEIQTRLPQYDKLEFAADSILMTLRQIDAVNKAKAEGRSGRNEIANLVGSYSTAKQALGIETLLTIVRKLDLWTPDTDSVLEHLQGNFVPYTRY